MKDLRITRNLIKNSFYCSISSLDSSGAPHTSPIGSVYLSNDADGYFIEMFTTSFKDKKGKRACIMAVNTSPIYWILSLVRGSFKTAPATRLTVVVGEHRKITNIEKERFQKRVRLFKYLKGYKKMWSRANFVRTFKVVSIKPVYIGEMTASSKGIRDEI